MFNHLVGAWFGQYYSTLLDILHAILCTASKMHNSRKNKWWQGDDEYRISHTAFLLLATSPLPVYLYDEVLSGGCELLTCEVTEHKGNTERDQGVLWVLPVHGNILPCEHI